MKKQILATIIGASLFAGATGTQGVIAATKNEATPQASTTGGKLFKGRIAFQVAKAENLWLLHKYDEAGAAFRKELKKHPNNLDARSGLGMTLVMQFKLDGAEEQFDQVLTKQPDNSLAHVGKAIVAMNRLQSSSKTYLDKKAELLAQAEKEARAAIEADPYLPQAHFALAQSLKEQDRIGEAYNSYKEAATLDPTYSDAHAQLGMIDLQKGRLPEASDKFQTAIETNSANSTAHYGLGEVYLQQKDIDAALKELNTALYLNRNSAPVHLALGKAYEAQGNIDAALKNYERAAVIKPEYADAYKHQVDLHLALGRNYETQNNTVAALKEYKQATLIDPHNSESYIHMAGLYENRGDLELAIHELRSGAELNPQASDLYQRMGDTQLKLEKTDDAIKAFERAISLRPGDPALVDGLSRAFYIKAQKETVGSFAASNEFEDAKATLQKAISLHPNDLRLRLAMAKLKSMSGEPVDLKSIGTPTNDAERVAYAEALLAQNKFGEAQQQMAQVIGNTNDVKSLAAVGDLALMIKDLDSADAAFKKSSKPDNRNALVAAWLP
jgi:Tfp pilus assembly protein PilF